ncbi:hypothetical protein [Arthrobacter flavus]|uniref:Lipoprotein n=1 Tax=Arthrobacter flavus TaxID=95172 RepID=A0ABW4Q800_9MICC
MKKSIICLGGLSLVLSMAACSVERLTTADTCIELSALNVESLSLESLPSPEQADRFEELSARSSEILSDELQLLAAIGKKSSDERERIFLIDSQYEAVEQAVATVSNACQ